MFSKKKAPNTSKKVRVDPFSTPLDDYEKELEEFLERGEYVSNPNFAETKKMFEEAAKRHIELRKNKSITLRVNQGDLIKVKTKAKRHNIPYQTLIGALIRQYAQGKTKINL